MLYLNYKTSTAKGIYCIYSYAILHSTGAYKLNSKHSYVLIISNLTCDWIWEQPVSMNTTATHIWCFCCGLFLRLVDVHECSVRFHIVQYPWQADKRLAVINPHDWLMSLPWIWLFCRICGSKNGTIGWHMPGLSEDIAFAYHSLATHLPSPTIL